MKRTVNRRTLLKTGAGAAVFATAASTAGLPQVFGTDPEGGTVPLRLPKGAMTDLDRGQYISNMEIHSHLSGASVNGGEPFGSLWAKGAQRMLVGGGGFVDISDPHKPVVANKGVYKGGLANVVYNTRLQKWLLMTAAQVPLTVRIRNIRGANTIRNMRRNPLTIRGCAVCTATTSPIP